MRTYCNHVTLLPPRAATSPRHVVTATIGTQEDHVKGRKALHAQSNSVTRHHRHEHHAPQPSRRARRGAPRGFPGRCSLHHTTMPFTSRPLLKVLLPSYTGGKMRDCGRCAAVSYCSNRCAKAHWVEHKLVCASMRTTAEELAVHAERARGGSHAILQPNATRRFGGHCELV